MTGRPTDYSEEILTKAQEYLSALPEGEVIHTIEGLALHIGITRETVYEWAKHEDKAAFSYIVAQLRTKKSKELQNKSLNNQVNASIAKLLLGHEGYRETQDITSNGKDLMPSSVDQMTNEELEKLAKQRGVS
jgi:hypothetical protein